MKLLPIATLTLLALSAVPTRGENLEHLRQLLSTQDCPRCDLRGAGLTLANLAYSNLAGADLRGANLSRATLAGADLQGADLRGASLFGANLSGANLQGALLNNADLRQSYLVGTNLADANIETAFYQDAIGLPDSVGSAELFYQWAMLAARQQDFERAIAYFNETLRRDPEFGAAYLGRGAALLQLNNSEAGLEDMRRAAALFEAQENTEAKEYTDALIVQIEEASKPQRRSFGDTIVQLLGTAASLFLQFGL